MGLLDAYVLRARVGPLVLISMPVLISFVGETLDNANYEELAAVGVVGLALLTLAAQLGRDRGKRIEHKLFASWAGKPTTSMLRHCDGRIDPLTKSRLHRKLSQAVNTTFPTPEEEAADPIQADTTYDSAVFWLRKHTEDRERFGRLHEENISYGFRRNLLGLKPFGIVIDMSLIGLGMAPYYPFAEIRLVSLAFEPSVAFGAISMAFLLLVITKNWVKASAENYAFALLNASDAL